VPTLPGVVTRVIDGDTADVKLASGPIRVRFHAIDTPERDQPGGREATAALVALVAGKEVDLEPFEQDAYNRLVARVYVDGIDVNGAPEVEVGYAHRRTPTCAFEFPIRSASA
jgi:endonuclease YncB( thermonuclease family)